MRLVKALPAALISIMVAAPAFASVAGPTTQGMVPTPQMFGMANWRSNGSSGSQLYYTCTLSSASYKYAISILWSGTTSYPYQGFLVFYGTDMSSLEAAVNSWISQHP